MTVRDYLVALVRTVVPVLVGLIVSSLAKAGLEVDPGVVSGLVDALFIGGYYAAVRYVEAKWPTAGWLLGWKGAPTYGG